MARSAPFRTAPASSTEANMRSALRLVVGLIVATAAFVGLSPAASATSISSCPSGYIGVYGEVGGNYFTICIQRPPRN